MNAYVAPVDPTDVAGKRIVSAIIDVGIGWIIYIVLFALLTEKVETFGLITCNDLHVSQCVEVGDTAYVVRGAGGLLMWLLVFCYFFGVFVLQRGLTGKTLGTMAMGIVTVDGRGSPPGIMTALVRSVAGIVDYIPCCVPLLGMILILTTKGHRRVGDMAARTFVIDRQYAGQPVAVPGVAASGPVGPYGAPMTASPPQAPYAQAPHASGPPVAPVEPVGPVGPGGVATPGAGPGPQSQPQWDPARNTYVQWDPMTQRWMMFDATAQQWRPIE